MMAVNTQFKTSEQIRESIENDVLAFLDSNGLVLDEIVWDTIEIVRCGTEGKLNGKDGAYIAHSDKPVRVWWQNYRTGDSGTWYAKDKFASTECKAFTGYMEKHRMMKNAIHSAEGKDKKNIYAAATDCTEHPYLTAKGVKPVRGLKVSSAHPYSDRLIVPMYDMKESLVGLQFIKPDGTKRFLAGTIKKEAYFPVGWEDIEKPFILIAEGLATAISLYECLGCLVWVAFDCGNLLSVAKMARTHYSDWEIILCADNDLQTKGNPGLTKATEAARAIGGYIAVPELDGKKCDWNDLHQQKGADEVRRQYKNRKIPTTKEDQGLETDEAEQENPFLASPPPPPLEAFHKDVQEMFINARDAFGIPIEIAIACFLALIASLVGQSRRINFKDSWPEAGNLWIAIVAKSGVGKTPCMQAFFRALRALEHKEALDYDKRCRDYAEALSAYKDMKRQAQKKKVDGKSPIVVPALPEKPIKKQITVDDATVEVLGDILSINPKGIQWIVDELSQLIFDMDKYSKSKGGTKSRLLTAHTGGSWKIDRSSNFDRSASILNAYVSITGGIQPDMLNSVFDTSGDIDSGFIPRFLFIRAVAEKPSLWNNLSFSEQSKELLDRITQTLWAWEVPEDEQDAIVGVSDKAMDLYIPWFNKIAEEAHISPNGAWLKKLHAHAMRICLLLHCLDCVLSGYEPDVSEDTMRCALMLADWLKIHQEQCWRLFSPEGRQKQPDSVEYALMRAIVDLSITRGVEWKITNDELFTLVQKQLGVSQIEPNVLGKVATRLGITAYHTGKERGRHITKDNVLNFKNAVSAVIPVRNATGTGLPEKN